MQTRFNGNVVPFADDATSTNRTVFGGTTQSDSIDDNLNANFKKGWEIVGLNDNPTREDFNAMGYTLGALTAYLYEMGIAEWNASQNYRINSRVIGSDGKIYKALTGTTGTPNVNHNPTSDTTNWKYELLNLTDYSTLTAKTTPVDADLFAIGDSTSSFSLKKLTWANLKATLKATLNSGFKNYLINGNFDVWQYKDAGLTYPQTSNGYGSDDRWSNDNSVSTKTHSVVACSDTERALFNANYFSRTTITTGGTSSSVTAKLQKIEDVTRLAGKTVTLSFWAKADSNKNIAIEFQQVFGTGGSPSASVVGIGSQLVALTTTWQKKTITVTIPSIAGKTIGTDGVVTSYTRLAFWFDAGASWSPTYIPSLGTQSGTFDIAQVQLEEGSVATPFEQRPMGLELSLCQRYFINGGFKLVIGTYVNSYNGGLSTYQLNPYMRTIPTCNITSQSGTLTAQVTSISNSQIEFTPTTTSGSGHIAATFTASAEL